MNIRKIEGFVVKAFNRLGIIVSRKVNPGLIDRGQEFIGVIKHISSRTLIDEECLLMLWQFANSATSLNGDVAEAGVYKGGSAKLLAKVFAREPAKVVFLFDTFTGMPVTDPTKDLHQEGDFSSTSLEEVQKFLSDCPNVVIFQGLFSDTFANIADKTFCFAHIDCDIYQSVRQCCEFFYPRMNRGGLMIFDDYGFESCPGAKLAIDEFFEDKVEYPILLPTKQCLVIRR